MNKRTVAILLSGGLDSTVAAHWAAGQHRVAAALSFNYSSKHGDRELECAAFQCRQLGIEHRIIDISAIAAHLSSTLLEGGEEIPEGDYDRQNMVKTVVPFRNGIFLSIAAGIAESNGADGLVIAAHHGDHSIYPDCREEFMDAMNRAIQAGTYAELSILRPFIDMDKGQIVALGHDLGVDFAHTYSCYKGGAVHCGACATCLERKQAFATAIVDDPTVYLA